MNLVAAVVVTFNRLELLKKVIDGLNQQTHKPDKIIIINNNSTDGTLEWLLELQNNSNDVLVITQKNVGSSGGQYRGSKTAFELGYEWIWIMDDDVVPTPNCLEELIKHSTPELVCHPLEIAFEGGVWNVDIKKINISNPFISIWKEMLPKEEYYQSSLVSVDAVTFEGPIFHRSIFEKVGFPEKKFFIYADDTEFSLRLRKIGIKFVIVQNAVLHRLLPYNPDPNIFTWKTYYMVRNLIAIDVLHGTFIVRFVRPFGYLLANLSRCKTMKNVKTMLSAFIDGYFYKSEN
jgi:GT2 family glycosyltransferase